jgi:hypothetical protein
MDTLTQQGAAAVAGGTAGAESSVSAVSWPAIFAGAFVASASSLVLVELGSGFGLASLSPWPGHGASAATFSVAMAIWLLVVQWLASGVGGYLAGRLRTKWTNTHTHEVFFRDTAHGFITWALATVVVTAVLTVASAAAVGAGVHAASTAASAASNQAEAAISPYNIDTLFRLPRATPSGGDTAAATSSASDARAEATRILVNGISAGDVPPGDRAYLADLVAARTGITPAEAQKRVDNAIGQAKAADVKVRQAADTARKAASEAAIYGALSMVIGAFIACVAAALGGARRDLHA